MHEVDTCVNTNPFDVGQVASPTTANCDNPAGYVVGDAVAVLVAIIGFIEPLRLRLPFASATGIWLAPAVWDGVKPPVVTEFCDVAAVSALAAENTLPDVTRL